MARNFFLDRVKVSTATTGTGTITLGSAAPGFRTFGAAGAVDLAYYRYVIEDGDDWELGYGAYTTAGTTLTRNLQKSSTGSLLNLSGDATVFVTAAAEDVGGPTYWTMSTSDYNLTSTTALQKLFNTSTNGAVELTRGTWEYVVRFAIKTMSATSGNARFDIVGAGTATLDAFYESYSYITAQDNSVALNQSTLGTQSGYVFFKTGTTSNIAAAAVNTGLATEIRGMLRVATSGTLIPSVGLTTAVSTAEVMTGSHAIFRSMSTRDDTTKVGTWT